MRVLVTGGAGYIGSVITDQLIEDAHSVVVYDNLSKGHRESVSERATFIDGDLLDEKAMTEALKGHAIDAVIHMAASSLVGESMTNPERYYLNNVIGSVRLLNAMLAAGVRMMVLSSTAATYGEPARQPISEDDPTAPSNPYGETKLAVERAMHWYGLAHQLRFVSLRYFNAAGATARRGERHDPETHLIPLVLRAARDHKHAVTIFGNDYPTRDGTCVRDYIHVSDLARAHVSALAALADGRLRAEIQSGMRRRVHRQRSDRCGHAGDRPRHPRRRRRAATWGSGNIDRQLRQDTAGARMDSATQLARRDCLFGVEVGRKCDDNPRGHNMSG